jgi:predicted transposase YbfD/YdcC
VVASNSHHLSDQTAIAKQILKQGGNYVLSLKENQETLHRDVASIFAIGEERIFKKMLNRRKVEKNRGHGRSEWRRYTLISARDPLPFKLRWPGLNSIGMIETICRMRNPNFPKDSNKDIVTTYTRYFLTSLHYDQIDDFTKAARQHWHIEINLHWSLDVSFHEDLNRTRIGNAAENLAIVRRIALNLLKQEKTRKVGISCKRKCAGWSNSYLLKLLSGDANIKNNENTENSC